MMDHSYVEQHDIVSRYLAGRLTHDQSEDFEAHLVDCPQCLGDLEVEDGLRRGLRRAQSIQPRVLTDATADRRTTTVVGWLAAAALLAIGVATGAAYLQTRRALADAKARVGVLETQVADARARAGVPPEVAVFDLSDTDATRSTGDAGRPPTLAIPSTASVVVISLLVQNADAYSRFHAELLQEGQSDRSGERSVWSSAPLFHASRSSVGVAVPRTLFTRGAYKIVLEGVASDGRSLHVADYRFRAATR